MCPLAGLARIAITFLYVVFATDPTMPKRSPCQEVRNGGAVAAGIWLELVNRSTPRRSMSSSLLFTENRPIMKSLTLPALSLPMKLVSLEEAQARSLATNHPARKERRENSLPEIVPPMGTLFHTVLELPDNK